MSKIIIIGHGELAVQALTTVEMIIGDQSPEQVAAIPFFACDSLETLIGRLKNQVESFGEGDLIVFADVKGGSPCNAAQALSKKYQFKLICGFNLPVLLEAVISKDNLNNAEQLEELEIFGKNALKLMIK